MSSWRKWIIGVVVVALGSGGAYLAWRKMHKPVSTTAYLPIEVTRGSIRVQVQATGTVQPENRLVIKPPINGRIDSLKVAEGDVVKRGQVLAMMSSTDRAALLDVARAKGPEEVKHWEDIYRATPIIAPMAGVIIVRSVEPGLTISTADQVFVMSDNLLVVAQVDETDVAKTHLGQDAQIVLDAYPAEKIPGQVKLIAFEALTVNNVTVYNVQVQPKLVPPYMRSGMTASVFFRIAEKDNVLLLPVAAVRQDKDQATVLRFAAGETGETTGEQKPERVPIKTGLTDSKLVEVVSGLDEGDTVLEEAVHLPDGKSGGSPFSPFGGRPGASGGGKGPSR